MWYYQTRGKGEGLLDNFVSMPRKNVCAHHKRLSFLTRQPTRWIHTHTADAQNKSKSKRKHNTMVRITMPKQTQFMHTRGIFEQVSDCSTVNLRLRRPRAILDLSHPNDGVQCTFGHCPRGPIDCIQEQRHVGYPWQYQTCKNAGESHAKTALQNAQRQCLMQERVQGVSSGNAQHQIQMARNAPPQKPTNVVRWKQLERWIHIRPRWNRQNPARSRIPKTVLLFLWLADDKLVVVIVLFLFWPDWPAAPSRQDAYAHHHTKRTSRRRNSLKIQPYGKPCGKCKKYTTNQSTRARTSQNSCYGLVMFFIVVVVVVLQHSMCLATKKTMKKSMMSRSEENLAR